MLNKIHTKKYYNQEYLIEEIMKSTKYSKYEIYNILNSLSNIIAEISSNTTDESEIKIATGIKIATKIRERNNSDNNICLNNDTNEKLSIKAKLTNSYKQKINELHKEIIA